MGNKGKQQGRREVFAPKSPPGPTVASEPPRPPPTLAFTAPVEPELTVALPEAETVQEEAPAVESDPMADDAPAPVEAMAEPINAAPTDSSAEAPTVFEHALAQIKEHDLELVASDDEPTVIIAPPVRRGHARAKVLVHGLNATGYTLDGELRRLWKKADVGEFPKASVDEVYLEAL